MRAEWRLLGLLAASAAALIWAVQFAWMAVAALRPGVPADIASLTPAGPFGLRNFNDAWQSGNFPLCTSIPSSSAAAFSPYSW
jgi:sn-glycerol 3-phosphate transport system permease protein